MTGEETFHSIVIGSGQGGTPLSARLADGGHRTALIERAAIGGTCVNVGCTPTKTLYASAKVAYTARRSGPYGVHAESVTVSQSELRERKRALVDRFRNGDTEHLQSLSSLEVILGEARFTGPKSLEVTLNGGGTRRLTAEAHVFINTGCRPAPAKLPGIESVDPLDSTSIMELDQTPRRLLIIGGGFIGIEFAQMFARFGSKVTVVQRQARILPQEDDDVTDAVAKILGQDGVELLLETEPKSVRALGSGGVALTVRAKDGEKTIEGERLMFAAGRVPNTEALGLDNAGVKTDQRGFIQVNGRLETSTPGVYALGDVKGGPAFTHISYDDYRILRANLLEGKDRTTAERLVPSVVYIDPQLGRVGLSEKEAKAKGLPYEIATMPMSSAARAAEAGETRGFMKALVDPKSGQILGCAILGMEGGELMSMIEIAMLGKLPYTALRDAIFAHPTLAESFNNLFWNLELPRP